jgi:hypothetical protein
VSETQQETTPDVQAAPDNVTPINGDPKQRKFSKIELKRMRAYQERRQRLINKGVAPDKVDMVLAAEDYANMPVPEKLKRLEGILQNSFQQVAIEMANLRHNDGVLADAMDLNFKSFAKMLVKLGIPLEDQGKIIAETEKEMAEERRKQSETASKAAQAAQENIEQAKAEEALKKAEQPILTGPEGVDANGSPIPPPDGATVFGG